MIGPLLRSLRPHQWAKNVLIFAPLVFGKRLLDTGSIGRALIAFLLFCMITGSIYILNDLIDVEQDREHPQKSHRPIASGAFPEATAWKTWPLLALLSIGIASAFSWQFGLVTLGYFVLNLGYCFRFKNMPYLDVLSISTGFVLRVLGGALVIQVPISRWILPCTFLLALYLALGKRRHELNTHRDKSTRSVLSYYRLEHLDLALATTSSFAILGYCGYTIDPLTVQNFGTKNLIYTVPFVVFAIVRFLQLVGRGAQMESPTQEILRDIPSILNVVLWAAVAVYIIYGSTITGS
jgi:4-hydroxybenzoate polyprenyltransferase